MQGSIFPILKYVLALYLIEDTFFLGIRNHCWQFMSDFLWPMIMYAPQSVVGVCQLHTPCWFVVCVSLNEGSLRWGVGLRWHALIYIVIHAQADSIPNYTTKPMLQTQLNTTDSLTCLTNVSYTYNCLTHWNTKGEDYQG